MAAPAAPSVAAPSDGDGALDALDDEIALPRPKKPRPQPKRQQALSVSISKLLEQHPHSIGQDLAPPITLGVE